MNHPGEPPQSTGTRALTVGRQQLLFAAASLNWARQTLSKTRSALRTAPKLLTLLLSSPSGPHTEGPDTFVPQVKLTLHPESLLTLLDALSY